MKMQIILPMLAEGVYSSEDEMFAIEKTINAAKKLNICIDLKVFKKDVTENTSYLIKPTDSYERVIRRWNTLKTSKMKETQ